MKKSLVPAESKWADQVGYSRAVRAGPHIWVAGTVAVDTLGSAVGTGDAYEQALHILKIVEQALARVGANMSDVVRTRVYLRDWSAKDGATRAHREVFAQVRPAATFVLAGLVEDVFLVEIEAEAFVME
ncbi:MAG: RidA family protein [Betaproteobacteria bacterium]|nr:RidA family protein [Betaproteobacteria bacterium]